MHSQSREAGHHSVGRCFIRMITESQLSLSANSWSVLASITIVIVAALVGYFAWRRSGYSTSRGLQELFRLMIVCMVALLLNQPEWIEPYQPESKPTVVVLWDDSNSMQTQDAVNSSESQAVTRATAIAPLTAAPLWLGQSDQNREVVLQSIGASDSKAAQAAFGTNLSQPLLDAAAKIDQLLAVVLISDGDWNAGDPPVDAAARLKLKGIPLHTIPVGSSTRLPDIELTSVEAPTFGTTSISACSIAWQLTALPIDRGDSNPA